MITTEAMTCMRCLLAGTIEMSRISRSGTRGSIQSVQQLVGEILEDQDLSNEVRSIMSEIYNLAKAQSIALPESIVEESYEKGRRFPYETRTSFQRDYEITGKKDERDLFGGTILRMGEEYKVDIKQTKHIYESLDMKKVI